jgi:hypothetical protein
MGWVISECLIGDPQTGERGNGLAYHHPVFSGLVLEVLPLKHERHRIFSIQLWCKPSGVSFL